MSLCKYMRLFRKMQGGGRKKCRKKDCGMRRRAEMPENAVWGGFFAHGGVRQPLWAYAAWDGCPVEIFKQETRKPVQMHSMHGAAAVASPCRGNVRERGRGQRPEALHHGGEAWHTYEAYTEDAWLMCGKQKAPRCKTRRRSEGISPSLNLSAHDGMDGDNKIHLGPRTQESWPFAKVVSLSDISQHFPLKNLNAFRKGTRPASADFGSGFLPCI